MKNQVIVIRLNAMGDILLSIPMLRELHSQGNEVHLVINDRWQALAPFLPARIHLFKGAGSLLSLAKELQTLDPSRVHDLQGKIASVALSMLLKSNNKTLYKKRSLQEQLYTARHKYPIKLNDTRPVWQKYAESAGIEVTNPTPELDLGFDYLEESKKKLQSLGLEPEGFIAIHRTASKPGKILPDELIVRLLKSLNKPLVLFGQDTGERLTGLIDLRNQIELKFLPGFLCLASMVISSDSGPMHLARAVNTPVVGIYLQTAPELGFSLVPGNKTLMISQNLDCKPCSLHGQNEVCPEGHFACRKPDLDKICKQISEFVGSFK